MSSSDGNIEAIPWWLQTIAIAGCILLAAGGVIALVRPAMLVAPGSEINEAAHTYAGYFASRNLAIAAALLVALSLRARGALCGLMALTALVQVFDAVMDITEGRWAIVPGVLVLGAAFSAGALWLRKARRAPGV